MAFIKHKLFTDPEETTLWRYMDFTKYISLMSSGFLYFPSARILQKIDPWEGSYLKIELEHKIKQELNCIQKEDISFYNIIKPKVESWKRGYEHQIDINYISCWHINTCESAAMWRLYLKSNEGVCIQTDIDSFKHAFKDEQKGIYIGKVLYRDYKNDYFYFLDANNKRVGPGGQNLFLPFIHKRKIYEHEKEYRAIVPCDDENMKSEGGIKIKVNLQTLIKRIIIAPSSPEWFEELVRATLKKYNLEFPVCKSEVDDKPYEFDLSSYEPKND